MAAAIHAAAVGGASATHLFGGWGGWATTPPKGEKTAAAAKPQRALAPTCDGDALLAVGARSLTCLSPFVDDRDACVAELAARLESDRLRCHVDELEPVAFSIEHIDPAKIPQLEPEPLLESLTEEQEKKFEQKQAQQQVALAEQVKQQQTQIKRETQVVETAKPDVEVAPDNARLVSEYNTKVDKEKVARGSDKEAMIAKSKAEALEVKKDPREATSKEDREQDDLGNHPDAPHQPGKLSMRTPGEQRADEMDQQRHQHGTAGGGTAGDGMQALRGDGLITSDERHRSELPSGHGGAGGGSPPVPNLRASDDVLERALGGGSVDHLDDVDDGEETALNTKQWIYASFFNRMKRQVHENWDPSSVWHRVDPNGVVYGFRTRITRVRVSLNPAGEIQKILVVGPSGVDQLDDEAVHAFKAAAPFPNPPPGLVDATGAITFEFGFYLQISGAKAEWKIFRSM